jgi:hypothetical protein
VGESLVAFEQGILRLVDSIFGQFSK